jgi:hypothetical protein
VIEGKVADVPQAKTVVGEQARRRVDEGIAHIAVGVVYPRKLRTTVFARLPEEMNSASLDFILFTDAGAGNWQAGRVNEIVDALRRAHGDIVRDDLLQQAVDLLKLGIGEVSDAVLQNQGASERLIEVLGIGGKPDVAAI